MKHLIDKDALVAMIKHHIKEETHSYFCKCLLSEIDALEVKEVDLENYNKVKKLLSLSFMKFLDENRQEGKMCLSNGECFDIEKAFDELDFSKLFRYMEKYLMHKKGE